MKIIYLFPYPTSSPERITNKPRLHAARSEDRQYSFLHEWQVHSYPHELTLHITTESSISGPTLGQNTRKIVHLPHMGEKSPLLISVVTNANFSSIERVRAPVFEYFRAWTSPNTRYSNIELTSRGTNIKCTFRM